MLDRFFDLLVAKLDLLMTFIGVSIFYKLAGTDLFSAFLYPTVLIMSAYAISSVDELKQQLSSTESNNIQ